MRPNFNVPDRPGYHPMIPVVMDGVDDVNAQSVNRIFQQMVENIHYVFLNRVKMTGDVPGHGHNFTDITGRISYNQIPFGTGANQVARGNHTHNGDGIPVNPVQGTSYSNGQVTLGFHPSWVTFQVEATNACCCGAHHTNLPNVQITRNATGFSIAGIVPGVTRVNWSAWRP